jgi:integrase/recombinase XerD
MQQVPVFVSFFLDASRPNADGACVIKMNVYQKPNKKRYGTKFHITKENWEKLNAPKLRDEKLKEIEKQLNALKIRAEKVIEKTVPFSFVAFEELFFDEDQDTTVKWKELSNKGVNSRMLSDRFKYATSIFESNDQIDTASTYRTTMNSVNGFKKNLLLYDITAAFLLSYESQLKSENKSLTTINIYMRNLRAVINDAIAAKAISSDNYPFKEYEITSGKNVKKALKNFDINKILNYQPEKPDHQKAIDYWIFSYLCNGMNFADIISLKPQNINGRFLNFYRQKTIRTK